MNKKEVKVGLVGCGHRGVAGFLKTLKDIGKAAQVAALCDTNETRLDFAHDFLGTAACKKYTDYSAFLNDPEVSTVIVVTPDHTHAELVIRAFKAGKDVICEKPMATTLKDCQAMIDASAGRKFRVSFNFRYNSVMRKVKELLMEKRIGNIIQVEAKDILTCAHGSDYFRRWHRIQEKSGGLLTQKGVHTFDMINWLLEDKPSKVTAKGSLSFYLPKHQKGERCLTCSAAETCLFYVNLNDNIPGQVADIDDFYRKMYLEAEKHDGYIRDTCVFHKDNTIKDTFSVIIEYAKGAACIYTSLFYAPYEDHQIIIQGDKGRIEVSTEKRRIEVMYAPEKKEKETYDIPKEVGLHGGADKHLMSSIFDGGNDDLQFATAEDGYWSLAVAECGNKSIDTGKTVSVPAIIKN